GSQRNIAAALTCLLPPPQGFGRLRKKEPKQVDLQLAGKKVLITGASQGIGEGLAEVFAEEGCNLHLVARSGAKLEALGERIRRGHGVKVVVQQQDIGAAGAGDAIA